MSHDALEGFRPSVQQLRLWQQPAAAVLLQAGLGGDIDAARLRAALTAIVARHEILRTRLHKVPGLQQPVQVIGEPAGMTWQERSATVAELEDLAAALKHSALQSGQPVPAAALVKLDDGHERLLLALPATSADRVSLERLLAELAERYHGDAAPGAEPLQYADFAEWQHELLSGSDGDAGRAFWQRQLDADLQQLVHPFERRIAGSAGATPAAETLVLDAQCRQWLQATASALRLTPEAILRLCWSLLLQRQLGRGALLLGCRHDGRNEATREALGPYAKDLPLRLGVDEAQSLAAAAAAQMALWDEAQASQESLGLDAAMAAFGFAYACEAVLPRGWSIHGVEADAGRARLQLNVCETGAALTATLQYDAGRFTAASIRCLLEQWQTLLAAACAGPQRPLRELGSFGAAQAERLQQWNATAVRVEAPPLLHQLFEQQVSRRPQATALRCGAITLSYDALNHRANRLAHRLRARGVRAEEPVGLLLPRSVEAVVGMLAILKAGGAYLPLDPAHPPERLALMIEESGARRVLSCRELQAKLPEATPVLLLDEAGADAGEAEHTPASIVQPSHLAYLIFTSGSTGRPKGVMVSHANAVASTVARWRAYHIECESFLLISNFAFDSSVAGLFWTLGQGGTLVLPPDAAVQDPAALARLIEDHQVTHTLMLPSLYGQLLESQPARSLASLRAVVVAGEAATAVLAQRHRAACPQAQLYNEYGPTEGSVWCSLHVVEDADGEGVLPIGRPIANMRVQVLDAALQPLAPGLSGEIYIAGAGIARGYRSRPDLTAERFLPDPYGPPGSRRYRTGDLGRWDAEGRLHFGGRSDHQVKIRGHRIELAEIELRLAEHPGVREAVVVARADAHGELRLVAYWVPRAAACALESLQQHLKARLPEYMLPAIFVTLERLPLNANGKLDRAALPEPELRSRRAYVAPRSEREVLLAQVWAEVLGVERVGLDDDFFELGGHSLSATRLVSRLRQLLQREVPVRAVFQHPRLDDFARHLAASAEAALPPVVPVSRAQALPLSLTQLSLWRRDRRQPGNVTWNVLSYVALHGRLDVDALQRSFDELLRRHEILRTRFEAAGHEPPRQVISAPGAPALPLVDLDGVEASAADAEVQRLLLLEERRPFDLSRGPLLRAGLIRRAGQVHVLWLCLHHIISDRWSMQVLVRELTALYEAFSAGQPSPLPAPALQYADYAAWQQEQLASGRLQGQLAFWTQQLRALPAPLQLPGMRVRPSPSNRRGASFRTLLGREIADPLRALCARQGVTLFMATLAAFKAALALQSGREELAVGILLANRHRLELENLAGLFANTVLLRSRIDVQSGFAALLAQVRDRVLAAQAHPDLPYDWVLGETQADADAAPLQVLFDLHQERILAQPRMGALRVEELPELPGHSTHYELVVGIGERDEGLRLTIDYCREVFDETLIERLAAAFRRLLETVAGHPDVSLAELARAPQAA